MLEWLTSENKLEEKRTQLNRNNQIVINVWLPKVNGKKTTALKFIQAHMQGQVDSNTSYIGHASLQTANYYASWWPADNNNEQTTKYQALFGTVEAHNNNYERDCKAEGGPPDLRVSLYSLNMADIENRFADITQDPTHGYVLTGDKKITRYYNGSDAKGQSCCGFDLI